VALSLREVTLNTLALFDAFLVVSSRKIEMLFKREY
jgi:hypothetical protein